MILHPLHKNESGNVAAKVAATRCLPATIFVAATFLANAFVLCGSGPTASAADPFRDRVVPFVAAYCAECHGEKLAEAQLNLTKYRTAEAAADDFRQWEHVVTFVERGEMPPEAASKQPAPEERKAFLATLREVFAGEAKRLAGDPGSVLPRRLTNAEYDHTIRDLTGVDIHPTRSFPIDPAAGEGFNNTGEALAMSPSLVHKLYGAAQQVADHAVMTTSGVVFAPYSTIAFEDRKQFFEQAILKFYETHTIDYGKALTACWEHRHRPESKRAATIEDWSRERGLSPKYVGSLYELLQGDAKSDAYYVGWLRRRWNAIPPPNDAAAPVATSEVRDAIHDLGQDVGRLGRALCPKETEAIVPHAGNAPVDHLERRRRTAAERNAFAQKSLTPTRRLHVEIRDLHKRASARVAISARSISPADAGDFIVALGSIQLSSQPPDSYRPNDEKQNVPLLDALSKESAAALKKSQESARAAGAPESEDALYLTRATTIELEIPSSAFAGKREIHLYADAQLQRPNEKVGCVALTGRDSRPVPGEPQTANPSGHATTTETGQKSRPADDADPPLLLVNPDHAAARDVAASGEAFCRLFPNRFYYADETRGLSAGFHLIEGFFRDDQPLCQLVLSEAERKELDRLWTELEFVTEISERMLRGFVFFERSERNFLKHPDFDSFKEEDPKLLEPETLARFEQVYLARANVKLTGDALAKHPVSVFFEQIRSGLASRRENLRKAEPIYLRNLEDFATRAYRRPLTPAELASLRSFYGEVASQPEFGVEQAVRASIVRILMSPHFGTRTDPAPAGDTVAPLPDQALASRLSYFLWASMPDAELRAAAEAGTLRDDEALLEQTRRMLKDERVSDFAREFFGQWLGYRDFAQQESVDRATFPDFDDALRQSMFEEPTRLAAHLIRHNRPVTELLDSDTTLIDARLAKHYALPLPPGDSDWRTRDGLRANGRGGILGMAVFLTKNSQPQRTSPVKRGFWVVHKVLGEHIPAPPADVVALPAKETDTHGKTVRELLALHVDDHKCARCHVRFDAVGLSMEGFDSIGRKRSKDLAGRPIDDVVKLSDGSEARGIPEFSRHLIRERRDDFVRTFCRKLLGYALGRSLQLSDEVLLEEMRTTLEKNGDRLVPLFETVVKSPQFRNQRCRDFTAEAYRKEAARPAP